VRTRSDVVVLREIWPDDYRSIVVVLVVLNQVGGRGNIKSLSLDYEFCSSTEGGHGNPGVALIQV
jgi:hypothetical protein